LTSNLPTLDASPNKISNIPKVQTKLKVFVGVLLDWPIFWSILETKETTVKVEIQMKNNVGKSPKQTSIFLLNTNSKIQKTSFA